MNKSNDNICNGGLHGYSEYTAQYSQWFNVYGKIVWSQTKWIKDTQTYVSLSTVYSV